MRLEELAVRILGVDPGYATIGYGIVDYLRGQFQPVEFGAITTPPKEPFPQRLEEIYDGIEYLIQKHRPEVMAVEELFFAKNQTTIIGVGQARGAILLAAQKGKLPVFEYTPMQVKLAIGRLWQRGKRPGDGYDPSDATFTGSSETGRCRRCAGYRHDACPCCRL